MAARQVTRRIGGELYVLAATVLEGESFFFFAAPRVAVEKFDMRPGGTEFDFQVMSRAVRDGRAESVIAMRERFDREFQEKRVLSNIAGLPVSFGNAIAVAQGSPIELTYGEIRPQVFQSRVGTVPVAWIIAFRRAHYAGAGGRPRFSRPTGVAAGKASLQARTNANASVNVKAATDNDNRVSEKEGGPDTTALSLRVYVRHSELPLFRPTSSFNTTDMIFDSPGIFDRLRSTLRLER